MSDLIVQHPANAPGDIPIKFKDMGDGTYALVVSSQATLSGGGGDGAILDGVNAAVKATVTGALALKVDGSAVTQPVSFPGAIDVSDRSARLLGHVTVDNASIPVTGTFFQATQPVSGAFFQATQPVSLATNTPDVTDRAARLLGHVTIDNASLAVTGTFFQATQPVSLATNTPDVTDRAARLLGHVTVDNASIPVTESGTWTVQPGNTANTTAWLVTNKDTTSANLHVTGTAAVNTAVTVTLPAVASQFHYITSIQIVKLYSVIGVAAGAGVLITSTNLPGGPIWTTEQLASPAGTAPMVVNYQPTTPLKSSVVNTATTIVCPVQLQTIWRVNVSYFTGT